MKHQVRKPAYSFPRRDFIKTTALTGLGIAMVPGIAFGQKSNEKVRIAFIGVGGRGRSHLGNLLNREDVFVPAICDIDPAAIQKSLGMFVPAGHPEPEVYTGHDFAYRDLLNRNDVDGVIISTPWLWHTRMAVDSMKSGIMAGVEVSAANTIEECWDLVNTYEETGVHTMIMENVCYRRDVMAVLNMVRQDVFGELLHARCGYRHDLRGVKFNPGVQFGEGSNGEARWRTQHSIYRNGDLYPTHGVGPIATMMNINRGNRFVSLTSHATKSRGLHNYIIHHPEGGPNHPHAGIQWELGDVVTTQINTANGQTILVTHDTNLPRPYSLNFEVQGEKGLTDFDYHTRRIYIEGISSPHSWDLMDQIEQPEETTTAEQTEQVTEAQRTWLEKYDHPLWKRYGTYAEGSGHGGMDFFVDHAFVEAVKRKEQPPLDAYDAAAWSAITPLSERSIAEGNAPQYFPDFTRGKWIKNNPVFAMKGDDY